MQDGSSRGADRTNHLNVGETEAATMKWREGNLLEKWGRGNKRLNAAKTQTLRLSKYK